MPWPRECCQRESRGAIKSRPQQGFEQPPERSDRGRRWPAGMFPTIREVFLEPTRARWSQPTLTGANPRTPLRGNRCGR
jgi:hypothetical protein